MRDRPDRENEKPLSTFDVYAQSNHPMSKRNRSQEEITINLTPMIDVVFLLVIFFMVGSKFSESESRIDVSIPSVGPMDAISRAPDDRIVELTANGEIVLDGQVVTKQQLAEILKAQIANYPGLTVVVRADSALSVNQLADAMYTVKRSGVQKTSLAFKVNSSGGGSIRR